MAWVVDQSLARLRDTAANQLASVVDQAVYSQDRNKLLEGSTRLAVGAGHRDGDRLIQDAAEVTACLTRSQSCLQLAIAQINQVNVMTWVDDS